MPEGRLAKLAFQESLALAAAPRGLGRRMPWASEMASVLGLDLPADAQQQVGAEGALHAARAAHFARLTQAPTPTVQRYLEAVGTPVMTAYKPAAYLTAVTSDGRKALAQLRTGSHWLRENTGRHTRPVTPRHERLCVRCGCGEVDDAGHMALRCAALADVRQSHAAVLEGVADLRALYAQPPVALAAYVLDCKGKCSDLSTAAAAINAAAAAALALVLAGTGGATEGAIAA